MTDTLPNETLRHILARLLDVPDEYFASDAVTLPFARQSDILLVCKRWMRVATSVLYGTAVLQSKAQAQALARAFQMNLSFSGFLKRLRIEGGFGVAVGQIMLAAKNLTELCITLNIHTDDEAICGALPSICPRRLILFGAPSSRATLREALVSAIPLWSQLVRAQANIWHALTRVSDPRYVIRVLPGRRFLLDHSAICRTQCGAMHYCPEPDRRNGASSQLSARTAAPCSRRQAATGRTG